MNERLFKNELAKIKNLQGGKNNPDYWTGYELELKRNYFGGDYGTEKEHLNLLLGEGADITLEMTRGYHAGLCVN